MERMIQICNILKKYCPNKFCPFFADNNTLVFLVNTEIISDEDIKQLSKLKVYYDYAYRYFVIYTQDFDFL